VNTPRSLAMIRMAMTSGILAFAMAVWYMRQASPPPMDPDAGMLPRRLALGASVVAVLALVGLKRFMADNSVERRNSLSVIAWAIGEFGAIAGIVAWFLSGAQAVAAPGMIAYVTALLMFPIRRAE
jgi:hypothetical protein